MTEFLLPALLATALAGLVRGFTGFGGALVMAPVLLTVIDPISTTAIVIIVNVVAGILQAREEDALRRVALLLLNLNEFIYIE